MSPAHLDEYPIHQSPHSLRHVPSSDRNFYDRCYFNAHDRTGDIFMVTGGGVYPNLGVIDAFVAVRRGGRQWTLRCSDAMDERPLDLAVGPYRVEVIEPLEVIRIVCDGDDHGLSLDLTWRASFPAIDEHPHLLRAGTRAILDAQRFGDVLDAPRRHEFALPHVEPGAARVDEACVVSRDQSQASLFVDAVAGEDRGGAGLGTEQ